MANNNVLLTELYPTVEKSLSNPKNTKDILNAVNSFLDRNAEKLTTVGPVHRIIFSEADMKKLYDAIGTGPNEIKRLIEKSTVIKSQWQIMNNPFNSAIAMTIRYAMLKNQKLLQPLLIYLTMSMYPSIHKKYFDFEPHENIMNYTINNLSNKYKIKQQGTIYNALVDTTKNCYDNNLNKLKKGMDKDIVDFIMDEKTRLNSLIKNISKEFYANHEAGKYLNTESDSFEEDNYHESDSNVYAINKMSNQVVLKLVVDGPDMKIVNLSAKLCQVSVSELRNYVSTMIVSEKREDITEIVNSILFLYLFDSQNTLDEIRTNKFLIYCSEVYKKSNTSDENIIKIKKILDKWLEDLGTYKKTQRLATINNFRRSLYMFFVMTIMQTA